MASTEHVSGKNMTSMSNLVQILWSGTGRDFNERYWGYYSNGTGTLIDCGTAVHGQPGHLLRYPDEFWGEAPDLIVSVFGIYAHSTSAAPIRQLGAAP